MSKLLLWMFWKTAVTSVGRLPYLIAMSTYSWPTKRERHMGSELHGLCVISKGKDVLLDSPTGSKPQSLTFSYTDKKGILKASLNERNKF